MYRSSSDEKSGTMPHAVAIARSCGRSHACGLPAGTTWSRAIVSMHPSFRIVMMTMPSTGMQNE